jgi:hypothetical protein
MSSQFFLECQGALGERNFNAGIILGSNKDTGPKGFFEMACRSWKEEPLP